MGRSAEQLAGYYLSKAESANRRREHFPISSDPPPNTRSCSRSRGAQKRAENRQKGWDVQYLKEGSVDSDLLELSGKGASEVSA